MTTLKHTFAITAGVLMLCALATAQEPAEPEAKGSELHQVKMVEIQSPGVDRPLYIVEFEATAIGRTTKYMVLLPKDYDDTEYRYPVLYMLHGFSQNYTAWAMMGVPAYSADLGVIIVLPDVGNSWYINWATSEGDELNNWEDFIIYDIIPHVDRTFRTIPIRPGRAISGLSMGGYGAIMLGLRHPDLFCSVASHSGTLDYARNAGKRIAAGDEPLRTTTPMDVDSVLDADVPDPIRIAGFTRQSERYPNGTSFVTEEDCAVYDPFALVLEVPREQLPHIYLDCGLGDTLLPGVQEFMMLLLQNEIPFTYGQSPGGHGRNYWQRTVSHSLAVQHAVLQENLGRYVAAQRQAAETAAALEAAAGSDPESSEENDQ